MSLRSSPGKKGGATRQSRRHATRKQVRPVLATRLPRFARDDMIYYNKLNFHLA